MASASTREPRRSSAGYDRLSDNVAKLSTFVRGRGKKSTAPIDLLPALLALLKAFKAVVRYLTGTSELFRLCDRVLEDRRRGRLRIEGNSLTGRASAEPSSRALRSLAPAAAGDLVERIDRCLAHSTKLKIERKAMESGTLDVDSTVRQILVVKLFPKGGDPRTPHAQLLRECVDRIVETSRLINQLDARAATRFDSDDPSHVAQLFTLWDLALPTQPRPPRESEQWIKLGFQGRDPATDFRGMGLLGLDNLVFFAQRHPRSMKRMLEISHHPKAWFSLAIVGINMTSFALHQLRKRRMYLQTAATSLGATPTAFAEFYSYLMDAFATTWEAHGEAITVMDFPRVFKAFRKTVKRDLRAGRTLLLETATDAPL
ncbi:ELMO domain-containing protein 1 [Geranomyces michiganensis]|nr:ELMO domain-containing protein 1 [Geranomyces michiganensis]